MTGECLSMVVVIMVMQMMLLRAGKREVALLSLPLFSVPVFYLLSTATGALPGAPAADILYPGMVLAGALVGIGGCFWLARYIRHRGLKAGYLTFGCVFLTAVTIYFLTRLLV